MHVAGSHQRHAGLVRQLDPLLKLLLVIWPQMQFGQGVAAIAEELDR